MYRRFRQSTDDGGPLADAPRFDQAIHHIGIGVGESLEDLQPFVADEFAGALLAD